MTAQPDQSPQPEPAPTVRPKRKYTREQLHRAKLAMLASLTGASGAYLLAGCCVQGCRPCGGDFGGGGAGGSW